MDTSAFRAALGRFLTGVCVVTVADQQGMPFGMTISSFTSLSLDPPLVLFCIDKKANSVRAYAEARSFSVNVLSEAQKADSDLFASQMPNKFGHIETFDGANGCKLLKSCLVGLECARTETLDGGDHLIVVGRVERIHMSDDRAPLARYCGQYRRLSSEK